MKSECSRGLVDYSKDLGSYSEQDGEQCEGPKQGKQQNVTR